MPPACPPTMTWTLPNSLHHNKTLDAQISPPPEKRMDVPADGKYYINPSNPMNVVKHLEPWYPAGISDTDILWGGNTAKVALLADGTVLKYVWDRDDNRAKQGLDIEHSILSELGSHERIVRYLGRQEHGLNFRHAAGGDVRRYLSAHNPDHQVRRKWAVQAAEALAFVHSKGVIHSDIHPNNLLLNERLDIQLCDFAGSLFGALDGGAMESVRFFLPRDPLATPDTKSDLFALGSTLYFIMCGHEPYVGLTEHEVTSLYSASKYPDVQGLCYGPIIENCWRGSYASAQDVINAMSRGTSIS